MLLFRVALAFVFCLFSIIGFAAEPTALQPGASSMAFSLSSGGTYSAQYRRQSSNTGGYYFGAAYSKDTHSDNYFNTKEESKFILAGLRHYLAVNELSSFVDMEIFYGESKSSTKDKYGYSLVYYPAAERKQKQKGLGLFYGLEYFVAQRFSIEGRAGVQYILIKDQDGNKSELIDFPRALVRINYYWD